MPVEIFNTKKFENALPRSGKGEPLFSYVGVLDNEKCWAWEMPHLPLRILIRSSVDPSTDLSADTGEDSIRIIIERKKGDGWRSVGKGPDAYTTRIKGWEQRLSNKIRDVFESKIKPIKQTFTEEEGVGWSKYPNTFGRPYAVNKGKTRFLDGQ